MSDSYKEWWVKSHMGVLVRNPRIFIECESVPYIFKKFPNIELPEDFSKEECEELDNFMKPYYD